MDLWTFWDLPADKKAFLWSCQSWRFLNLWKLVQQSCKERRRKRTSNREPSFCRDVARPVIWNYLYAIIEIINETICIFEANVYDLFASARHVSKLNSRRNKNGTASCHLARILPSGVSSSFLSKHLISRSRTSASITASMGGGSRAWNRSKSR